MVATGGILVAVLAGCGSSTSTQPVYTGDFPDPSIIQSGTQYYAFATQAGGGTPAVQRLTSVDHVNWTKTSQPDALQAVPAWADRKGTWAPSVIAVGSGYLMYYTVHKTGGFECVAIAAAASPANQFTNAIPGPLICAPAGDAIDPAPYLSPTGTLYLAWKMDTNSVATIYAQPLTPDGLSFAAGSQPATMLTGTGIGWANNVIEGPAMLQSAGQYFLFYSGNRYTSANYGIGYAVCASPLGPCANRSNKAAWMASHANANGPGGESFFTDNTGATFIAYHAWGSKIGYDNGGSRALWIDPIHFTNGTPTLG